MGEFIYHKSIIDEEKVKIGVCNGDDYSKWESYFSKGVLVLLHKLGFRSTYGSKNALNLFIKYYNSINTSFVYFSSLLQIIVSEPNVLESVKEDLLGQSSLLLLPVDGKVLYFTDKRFEYSVKKMIKRAYPNVRVDFIPLREALPQIPV